MSVRTSNILRAALAGDAVVSGATGLVLMMAAGYVDGLLGLPAGLMRYAGASLIPFAALVGYLASRQHLPGAAVWAVIVYNVLWALDSVLLLVSGWVAPTALGTALVIAQALAVAAFAELQYIGLKRSPALA
jgi:hypothetical protein